MSGKTRKKIIKLYSQGYTIKAISETVDVSYGKLKYFIKKRIEEGTLKSRKEVSND